MGSDKFRDENEYDSFLSSHGGTSNAFTELVRHRQAGRLAPSRGASHAWWPHVATPAALRACCCLQEHTNYFFDVAAPSLEGALDRFAQFFVAPLFQVRGGHAPTLAHSCTRSGVA